MKKYSFIFVVLLLLSACSKAYLIYDVETNQLPIHADYPNQDEEIESIISPYRDDLASTMNKVIARVEIDLFKDKPSSSLGNLLADATLAMASEYTHSSIDIGIINYGGIRVPSLTKGPVTIGNVYELMPFDNYLVVLSLTGKQVQSMLDAIAASGGWPVAGVTFTIKDNTADDVQINGKRLHSESTYHIAISDYLANGGDNMNMLKGLPQENTNVLLRDAFKAYFVDFSNHDQALPYINEMRIIK